MAWRSGDILNEGERCDARQEAGDEGHKRTRNNNDVSYSDRVGIDYYITRAIEGDFIDP